MFDVALWVTWPSLFPEHVAVVVAASAFAAIEFLMGVYGLSVVAHAAATLGDGSLVYRAFAVRTVCKGGMCYA